MVRIQTLGWALAVAAAGPSLALAQAAAGRQKPAPAPVKAAPAEPAPAPAPARDDEVPREYEPPAGLCRVWVDGVPADRQPAPTDCATAVRNRPNNARVIFGPTPTRR